MANKPIINLTQLVFDALYDFTVKFSWSGNQAFKNRLLILNANTSAVVYDQTISSTKLEHLISLNTLTNNVQYTMQIQTFDTNNVASTLSDKVFFKCLATPSFSFSNITNMQVINNSHYEFIVNYSQANDDILKEYQFTLYDSTGNSILCASEVLFSQTSTTTTTISYLFSGLENNGIYYVQCTGKTVQGFTINTAKIKFSVNYIQPSTFTTFQASCDPIKGYISYNTNIIIIQYNGQEVFNYLNNMVDLRTQTLTYNQGINISDDFNMILKFGKINSNTNLLTISNQIDQIKVDYKVYDDGIRFKLTASNGVTDYVYYTSPITIVSTDLVKLSIKRIGCYYQLDYEITHSVFS